MAEQQRVGYARCSTDEQDVAVQIEQLTALGVDPDRICVDRGARPILPCSGALVAVKRPVSTANAGVDRC